MKKNSKIIILSGNSGSGKTSVAKSLQNKFGHGSLLIFPEMEIGDVIGSLHKEEYNAALIAGYESIHNYKINTSYLKAFTALSVIGYIVIHHNKVYKDEQFIKAMERWCNSLFAPESR